ncbi:glycosyl hydrolase family 28 protein [Tannerella sp.]|uniref:glycosyl hydrolase family 28 protein n=1 Tax=Tannerella sp. TaxID=2382127 RepID=UPI0026DC266A|nr:glycosyl hydrolase family 28 protein [Tannerella sp.]MDO4703980.1 glycosyl hydrolase family 28 protein [Tannerella sp.]
MKSKCLLLLFIYLFFTSCRDTKFELDDILTSSNTLRSCFIENNGVQKYTYANTAPPSKYYSATVDGVAHYVYPVPCKGKKIWNTQKLNQQFNPEILSFGIEQHASVTIKITPKDNTKFTSNNYTVRPKINGHPMNPVRYSTYVKEGSLFITLKGPQILSIEKGEMISASSLRNPLLIFANNIESAKDKKSYTYYYEEGKIHQIGNKELVSGQKVYIAPGAIVEGTFIAQNASGVSIEGRGILSGENTRLLNNTQVYPALIQYKNTTNSTISGITLVNSKNWTMPLFGCKNITINGVRVVSETGYEDGLDIVGCQNIFVRNSFIWSKDDCIAIKAGANYIDFTKNRLTGQGDVRNIKVENCILWNGAQGNALEIGCELNTAGVGNIKYSNIDILHAQCPIQVDEGVLSINNNGKAQIFDVYYNDINIEDMQRYFINIKIERSVYSPGGREYNIDDDTLYIPGTVWNINYNNIYLTRETNDSVHSAMMCKAYVPNNPNSGSMGNINFSNIYINGFKKIYTTNFNERFCKNSFVLCLENVYPKPTHK